MKKTITILSLLLSLQSLAQQAFYEFANNGKYGIADTAGKEIVPPMYEWAQYILDYKSPFIALNSHNNGALIIHKETGIQEKVDYLAGAMLLDIEHANGKEWIHMNKNQHSYLINNKDLNLRMILPKFYKEIWQRGPYLICFTKYEGYPKPAVADILDKNNFKIIKPALALTDIYDYIISGGKQVFVVQQEKDMLVFDNDFKKIGAFGKVVKQEEIEPLLLKKFNISIFDTKEPQQAYETAGRGYPYYDGDYKDGYNYFYVYEKRDKKIPLLKFKNNGYRTASGEIRSPIEISKRKDNSASYIYVARFYLNPKTYFPLYPKKYWKEIDLTLLERPTAADYSKPFKVDYTPKAIYINTTLDEALKIMAWEIDSSMLNIPRSSNAPVLYTYIEKPTPHATFNMKHYLDVEKNMARMYAVEISFSDTANLSADGWLKIFSTYFTRLKDPLIRKQLISGNNYKLNGDISEEKYRLRYSKNGKCSFAYLATINHD